MPASGEPRALPSLGRGFVCVACELRTSVALTESEARYLAATHDRLHHGGVPTAVVAERRVCESCRCREAVTSWSHPAAGAPFALCQPCAALAMNAGLPDASHDVDLALLS